jgi:anti-sigma regulatory factor (Ser/Thr protein kinase)
VNHVLHCHAAVRDECVVASPRGTLDLTTYAQLREQLLKHAVEQPRALVVNIVDLEIERDSLLSVFAAVWLRTSDWPAVPLLLVAQPGQIPHPAALRRYVAVHGSIEDALGAVGVSPGRRRSSRCLPRDPASVSVARTVVREVCAEWKLSQNLIADAVLVAAELVTNAVDHARSEARLRLELRHGTLTVAVGDDDDHPAVLRESGTSPAGLGLLLIAQVAATWGCVADREKGSKVVWAVLSDRGRRR